MRWYSIRIKMIAPIALLAMILLGILIFMLMMTRVQQNAMHRQAENYFEAVSVVLNADRDIYQALIAEERLMGNEGDRAANKQDFEENAQQVYDRFHQFRDYLADEPEVVAPFHSFDGLYQTWLTASRELIDMSSGGKALAESFKEQDEKFQVVRDMLDDAGDKLRIHTDAKKNEPGIDLQQYVEALSAVLNADRDMYQAKLSLQRVMTGVGDLKENTDFYNENIQQALQRFHNYRSYLIREPDLIKPYERFDEIFNEWVQAGKAALTTAASHPPSPIDHAKQKSDTHFQAIRAVLDQAGEAINNHAREQKELVKTRIAHFEKIAIVVVAIAFIVAMGVGYYIPLSLTRNVEHISRRIREIADGDGDLTQRIQASSRDELGDLSREFDGFVEKLRGIIDQIQQQSVTLGSMTGGLNTVSAQADHISEGLVSATDAMVSAGSQMSVANRQMADLAGHTADEANHSSQLIQQGLSAGELSNQAIAQLVADIEVALTKSTELEKNSQTITSVLEVINKIAEQTNLLALNAAIEAARAGEQGRGFAVVADEVRTLANRTQNSTSEIEKMIQALNASVRESAQAIRNSQTKADSTVANVSQVISVFDTLNTSFERVQQMAAQTALATDEQAQVSAHISENLSSLKDQSDGVSVMSEQLNTQAQQISALYAALNHQVKRFKI